MTNDKLLAKFGKILMTEVRDESIEKFELIATGKMKSVPALSLNKKLSTLTQDQLSLVREVVVSSVDDTLHSLLWMLEQHEDVELMCSEGASKANMNEVSDGLSGETYTDDGWISQYSKYRE